MFDIYFMTNAKLEEELRFLAERSTLPYPAEWLFAAAEIIHDYDRVKQSESIYREEFTKAVESCAWMHDDKTLGIAIGARITVDGVLALKRQRDELREALTSILDWSPQPDPNDHPITQGRFIADLKKAQDILSNVSRQESTAGEGQP